MTAYGYRYVEQRTDVVHVIRNARYTDCWLDMLDMEGYQSGDHHIVSCIPCLARAINRTCPDTSQSQRPHSRRHPCR